MVEHDDKQHESEVVDEHEILPEELEVDDADGEAHIAGKLKQLREKLAACTEEKRVALEDLQRARADFLNSKRRLEEQLARDRERATDKLLFELLTIFDSFDTATQDKELWNAVDERWRKGMEGIHAKLLSLLKHNNVEAIDPVQQPFNPEEHEAVSNQTVTEEGDVDRVIAVLQKGFKRNGTILRPARVVVGTK